MNEMLGYISKDVHALRRALGKQTGLNILGALVIFACVCKISALDARVKALEAESYYNTEGDAD